MRIRRALLALLAVLVTLASLLVGTPAAEAQTSADQSRVSGVTQAINAFELYGLDNDTYTPTGSGYLDRGRGWFNEIASNNYDVAISDALAQGGYLPPGDWDNHLGSSVGDFWVYQCIDRVAVFSKSDGIAPTTFDSDWWATNNCNNYALNTLNLGYFQLSAPLDVLPDWLRVAGVGQAVDALERFGFEHDSYTIPQAGYLNRGRGWFEEIQSSNYSTSLASVLVDGDYIDGELIGDPGHDLWIYQCQDRVAVFSKSDDLYPSPSDSSWWASNGCDTYAIDTLHLDYFQLSQPLSDPNTCKGLPVTATSINSNGEIVGTAGDDVIRGTAGDDVIRGLGGNDIICGLSGDDWIRGDSGDDFIVPGTGTDLVEGGNGDDTAQIIGSEQRIDDLRGGAGSNGLVDYVGSSVTCLYDEHGNPTRCDGPAKGWRPW